jgi:hypothetical protein
MPLGMTPLSFQHNIKDNATSVKVDAFAHHFVNISGKDQQELNSM